MDRSSAVKTAVLVVCFAAGVGIVLLVAGGDDEPAGTSASASPAAAANTATAATRQRTSTKSSTSSGDDAKTQTQGKEKKGAAGSARTRTQTTAPLEIAPKEATKRFREQAAKAKARGARSCPDVGEKDAGAIDITATGVSCATAKKVIFANAGPARRGLRCDIVNESFADVPTILYACTRTADSAAITYTAVG